MFYLTVEKYLMKNRQRKLMKELELKRQLRGLLKSKSDNGLHIFAQISDLLRNRVHVFRSNTSMTNEVDTSLTCVVC